MRRRDAPPGPGGSPGRERPGAVPGLGAGHPRLNLNLRTGGAGAAGAGHLPAGTLTPCLRGPGPALGAFIPRDGQFPVKGHCLNSALHSVPACQSIVKKAVAARLGEKYGLNTLPETGALYPDPVLHYEGHRHPDAGHLRGGAAQAGLPGPRGGRPPAGDPGRRHGDACPGTGAGTPCATPSAAAGTIPIEAALIAKNRAPGLNRTFSAQKWACCGQKAVAGGRRRGHGPGV